MQRILTDGLSEVALDPVRNPANPSRSDRPDDSPDDWIHRLRALALARAALALVDIDAVRVRGLLADLVDLIEAGGVTAGSAIRSSGPRP